MMESDIKYLSHKIKRKKKWLDAKNHIAIVSEPKIVKIKTYLRVKTSPRRMKMRYLVVVQ